MKNATAVAILTLSTCAGGFPFYKETSTYSKSGKERKGGKKRGKGKRK